MRNHLTASACGHAVCQPLSPKATAARRWLVLLMAACCLLLSASLGYGQNIKNTQNSVDFKERSDVHVDPATLSMQLQIPLGSYEGRGGMSFPVILNYSPKLWRMPFVATYTNEGFSTYRAEYSESSASGWTSNLDWFKWPSENHTINGVDSWTEKYDSSGNAVPGPQYTKTVARIHVILPDGSRHEMRREDTILPAGSNTSSGTFLAVDGSRMRYESATRTLYMSDGSRLVYGTDASGNLTVANIDRNGNQNSYSGGVWTDSVGRSFSAPPLNNSTATDYTYTLPGIGGASKSYTFRWRNLSDVLTDPSQPLRYVGDRTWNYPYLNHSNPALFTSSPDDRRAISNSTPFNPVVLYQIVLPDNRAYTFTYNVWGEIDKIVFPTGAYETFSYGVIQPLSGQMDDLLYAQLNRGVVTRSMSPSGQGSDLQTWQYGTALDSSSIPYRLTRAITNPDGSYQQIWYHTGRGQAIQYGFEDDRTGKAFEERVYTANPNVNTNAALLRRTLTDWTYDWTSPLPGVVAYRNARPQKKVDILVDTGSSNALAATTTYQYDGDLNIIAENQYANAYVAQATAQSGAITAIPVAALLCIKETTYLVNDGAIDLATRNSYRSRQLIALPSSSRVKEGSGAIVAQTGFSYDEAAYPVLNYGAITGWSDPGTTARGLVTTTRRWLDTSGTYIETHAQYDQAGNVRYSRDGRGALWETRYDDSYADGVPRATYAYPTLALSPVPDSAGIFGSTTPLQTTTTYDYSTGLVTATTDANNQATTYAYADPLNRPTQINRPDGGYTTYGYGRNTWGDYVHTQNLLNSATGLLTDSYSYTDGLGRPSRSFQYENSDPSKGWLTNDTQYDVMGRVWRTANTYRSAGSATAVNPSGQWTTMQYDALGRMTSVTPPDGAAVTTSYYGNQVMVTDAAGKKRSSYMDALGRLAAVVEDPGGQTLLTEYTYDALDNLRVVKQGDQRRYFMYDSLSRLIRARNPEQSVNTALDRADVYVAPGDSSANSQWSMAYAYDSNGNLLSRTDARGVTANYSYDNLNRNIRVAYPDTNSAFVDHYYDGATNGRGLAHYSVTYVNSSLPETASVVLSYDAMGRPLQSRQRYWGTGAWGATYDTQRTYDVAGHTLTQSYPSGHTVNYSYDVMGRTATFTGNLGDGVTRTYMAALAFDNEGRMTREQFGTDIPLYNKRHYNVRGQLYDIRLSSVNDDGNWNRGAVVNYYSSDYSFGGSLPTNNGNLLGQQYWIPGDDAISTNTYFQQNYDYDALNRLSWASLYNGGTNTGFQQYSYDRYGNRTTSSSSWGNGINTKQFSVDAATNRLGVPAGSSNLMQYDANGNLTNDTWSGFGSRVYDAENRIVSATDSGAGQSTYAYDGEGRRVKRQSGGQTTWQVYGINGELVAEYAVNAAGSAPQKEYGYRNGELLITADGVSAGPVNLALGKSATQINSPFGAPASRAVDGNTDGNWAANSVTHTDYNSEAWWEVDLGSVQSIDTIKLWNRTDCCAERLSNFYILVSDVPFTSTDLTQTINQSGVSNYYTLGTVNGQMTQTVNRTGRYVRVQLGGTNYLSLAEVQVLSSGSSGGGINWLVTDQLGTPRMVADKSGSLNGIRRHDYLPFGEELSAGVGGRTTAQGFLADGVRQQFTGKERDNDTELDYFGARYYSSTQGRFTSPDEFTGGPGELYDFVDDAAANPTVYADLTNPQSLNKYQYTYNNPLRYTDPDGHWPDGDDMVDTAIDVGGGVFRGIASSLTFGAAGAPKPTDSVASRVGQTIGSVGVGLLGAEHVGGGAAGGLVTSETGVGAAAGALVVTAGVGEVLGATRNLAAIATTPMQNRNSSDDRAGKDFTRKGKQEVIEQNKVKNGGANRCENCGTQTVAAQKSLRGVKPARNETQVDHIKPKSKGGQGRPNNGQVLCRACNRAKSNKTP